MSSTDSGPSRTALWTVTSIGIVLGVLVAVATRDVILGVIAGSALIAVTVGMLRLWTGGGSSRPRHP